MFQKPRTESTNDLLIPTLKVQIHRRKSTNDRPSKQDQIKEILSNFRQKRVSIPKIELAYQPLGQDSIPKPGICESRPLTSPISVMLKSGLPERSDEKFKKSKLKDLPNIRKPLNLNPGEISVSGSSVNYCDWVGVLLYNTNSSPFPGLSKKLVKLVKHGNSTTTNRSIQKVKRKLFKGRCLLFGKTAKENRDCVGL